MPKPAYRTRTSEYHMRAIDKLKAIFLGTAALLTLVAIYLALIRAPPHATMGDVQRIFYFHVAFAWISYIAFGVTFVAGILYLKKKKLKIDTVAYSSAEIGVVFCTVAIVTGSLWGKAVWWVFWRWSEVKLFITFFLWLEFIAYLALRANVRNRNKRANLGAVFGIIGFITIPLSFAANRIWNQIHPTVVATSEGSLRPSMTIALVTAVFAFTFLYLYILLAKVGVEKDREKTEEIKRRIGDRNV